MRAVLLHLSLLSFTNCANDAMDLYKNLSRLIRQDKLDAALRLAAHTADAPLLEQATERQPEPLYYHTAIACGAAMRDRADESIPMIDRLLRFCRQHPWSWPVYNMLEQLQLGVHTRASARSPQSWRRPMRLAKLEQSASPPPVLLSKIPAIALVHRFLNDSEVDECLDAYESARAQLGSRPKVCFASTRFGYEQSVTELRKAGLSPEELEGIFVEGAESHCLVDPNLRSMPSISRGAARSCLRPAQMDGSTRSSRSCPSTCSGQPNSTCLVHR